jgi:pimeloyl-ACP methyl ester carboxylesterase
MQLSNLARLFKRAPRSYDGGLFTSEIIGRGATDVLLVHGLAASPETWEQAAERLGPAYRLHLVHMRGFAGEIASAGRQPQNFLHPLAEELAAYLRIHAKGPAAVAGHSMGGIASLILARDHPGLVDRLMVVDVPAFFSVLITPFATGSSIAPFANMARRRYVENDPKRFEAELRRATDSLVQHPIARERVVHWGLLSDRAQTADVMAEVMTTDLRGDLRGVTAPTDIIYAWSRSGHATRAGLDQTYAAAYSNLQRRRLLRIDDARHYVMFDQPDIFYQAMNDWLGRPKD